MQIMRPISMGMFAIITLYTIIVIASHGTDLITPFLSDLFALNWSGQFNLDFALYLVLSALWIAWRNAFSGKGILIAVGCGIFGMVAFAAYLIFLTYQSDNLEELVTGKPVKTS